jgi:hypothetical protein
MSNYRYSRFLLGLYPRLAIAIYALLVILVLEEFESGEEIAWYCVICKRSMEGVYADDMDKHPYCEGNDKGKKHGRMKMTAVSRT